MIAAQCGHADLFKALLKAGANPNPRCLEEDEVCLSSLSSLDLISLAAMQLMPLKGPRK